MEEKSDARTKPDPRRAIDEYNHSHRYKCPTVRYAETIEQLLGLHFLQQTLEIRVVSTGCTEKDNFRANKKETKLGPVFQFIRMRPDPCDQTAHGKDIVFSLEELGIGPDQSIGIANPFQREPATE